MSKLNRLNEKIWQFFSSVDLAVALFIVISIGAAIGTVIPQRSEPDIVIKFFSKFLPMNLSLNLYEIVSLLDLNNVYHSWWFTFLLFMFALNLVICSIDRLPNLLKSIKKPTQPYPESFLRSISTKKEFIYKSKRQEILEKMLNLLKHNKFSTTLFETSQGIQIYCSRWSKSRLAVYLTHFSILIILAG
ncbi:MAG: cytochrome c biogenesis protein ResB, partial [Thermodesulfovibrio sp.]|nr:cytochrome c biogenesis protein ResB [Thermodesulfovibrio sp.]